MPGNNLLAFAGKGNAFVEQLGLRSAGPACSGGYTIDALSNISFTVKAIGQRHLEPFVGSVHRGGAAGEAQRILRVAYFQEQAAQFVINSGIVAVEADVIREYCVMAVL